MTFFAALLVLQVLCHTLIFLLFERLAFARESGARLALNCSSPVNEFGLEHWNHALNSFYWATCPALLGVFLLIGVGFAQPDILHNAAHDARHAFAFPCH